MSDKRLEKIERYIRENWDRTLHEGESKNRGVISLPYPYNVPCIDGNLKFLFYWDAFYLNLGLLRQGFVEQAKNNVQNVLWMLKEYGYVPNSTAILNTNRSQPPYLSRMVRDLYEATGDKEWLASAVAALKEEYEFWMTDRITETGLNRHFHSASTSYLINFRKDIASRLKIDISGRKERLRVGAHYLAEAETGWDFTPRFEGRCADYLPVDLNSNLYVYETNFAFFSEALGAGEEAEWSQRAAKRKELMTELLWDEKAGLFLDYDFVNGHRSPVMSLASFHPLWSGLATDAQAARTAAQLGLFEYTYGLAACDKEYEVPGIPITKFQWGFPAAWPPLHYVVPEGLDRYGHHDDAKRIAGKFLDLVARNFEETDLIWEKYDAVSGGRCNHEYPSQDHLGWTAGVFVALKQKYSE